MTPNVTLIILMGCFYAGGIYFILERSLTRLLLGLLFIGNGTNILLLLSGGYPGLAPLFSSNIAAENYNDPLPQAMILTSIVITFAITAFTLAIIYRSWSFSNQEEVEDDDEDIRVATKTGYEQENDSQILLEDSEFMSETSAGMRKKR